MDGISKQGKDVDREILMKMDDKNLLKYCHLNQYMYHKVCDDNFFRVLLEERYPDTIVIFTEGSWKERYLQAVYWIAKLQEDFDYEYGGEDPKLQHLLFVENKKDTSYKNKYFQLWVDANYNGQISLVKHLLNQGQDIHEGEDRAIYEAAENGHLDLVKYLISQGADIAPYGYAPFRFAAEKGHLNVVKYLVSQGADIHAVDPDDEDTALLAAEKHGHTEVVEYLKSLQK